MISSLRGTVIALSARGAVIEVGGVGMSVYLTPAHAQSLAQGTEIFLHTTLIVRDDELSLYGFASLEQLELFELLRSVSGVGPRSALGVLAELSPAEVVRAVADEDDAPFRRVSGVGPKTAKLITISLAGKLSALSSPDYEQSSTKQFDLLSALVGLGWPERTALQVVNELLEELGQSAPEETSVLLRMALARLAGAGVSR